ncbi:phospholipase A2 inhibitor and Ly6/PLAUR domain-containing protein isoform X2 [Microcaecilia unicolor]|uniref:Phospholipase A2 inhibitor and Ly6/PLAUR domain-containing protein-like isoform X2 n=1 Tax=Microcaecilia unicolor TaxID=1415580 RepID=A0A6P7YR16_9AMPH|nr:phospholipase A2 inhibitor and Ly6/PLAUR domain-containing protein-like isoform X2 [Microcaecilia unicolor]
MRAVLTGLCILSALIVPGTSLSCQECTDLQHNNCTSAPKQCQSSQTHCVSILRQTVLSGSNMMSIIKSCGTKKDCDMTTSTNAGNFQMITISRCCNTDNCNTPQINIPAKEIKSNGLYCMSCYSGSSHTCDKKENTTCVGGEDRCIQYDVTVTAGGPETKIAVHGCATKNLCDTQGRAAYYGSSFEMKSFQCSSGTRPQLGLFLSALTGLLFMKLFS